MKRGGKKEKFHVSHVAEQVLCLRIRRLEIISSLLCPAAEHMLISEAKDVLFVCKRPPMGKQSSFSQFSCLKKGMMPTSFISML